MYSALANKVGIKRLKDALGGDLEPLYEAMEMYARRYHKLKSEEVRKLKRVELLNKKKTTGGKFIALNLEDYINREGWSLDSYEYIYPGIVRVIVKNVSEKENPKKSYRQEVTDATARSISRRVAGVDFEKTPEFIEESLIRKHKIIK